MDEKNLKELFIDGNTLMISNCYLDGLELFAYFENFFLNKGNSQLINIVVNHKYDDLIKFCDSVTLFKRQSRFIIKIRDLCLNGIKAALEGSNYHKELNALCIASNTSHWMDYLDKSHLYKSLHDVRCKIKDNNIRIPAFEYQWNEFYNSLKL